MRAVLFIAAFVWVLFVWMPMWPVWLVLTFWCTAITAPALTWWWLTQRQ